MKAVLVILFVFLPSSAFAQVCNPQPTPPVQGDRIVSFQVPMKDSVALATDAYIPDILSRTGGALLTRTPYNKFSLASSGTVMTQYGVPVFIQDVRGRYASHGTYDLFWNTINDGPQTLNWIARYFELDRIVTHGFSANGIDQYFIAGEDPEFLACQFIGTATPNLYGTVFQGGQLRKQLIESWLEVLDSSDYLEGLIEQEIFTMAYWGNVCMDDDYGSVNVPAIHLGGWYDCFLKGTLEGFMGYHYNGGPGAAGQSKLIIGPWRHGGTESLVQGELTYPANSQGTFSFTMFLDMFAYSLGVANTYASWPTVSYYVMGDVTDPLAPGNEWEYAADWPPPSTEKAWYFHDNDRLSMDAPTGSYKSYLYNPNNPVPTVGGQNLFNEKGPYDQTSVEDRNDVLVFTSPILAAPYKVAGPVKARLFVSSNCPDTDFTAKLTDVYPDGRSMLITDGILRMRNRNGVDKWDFMQPGVVYEIEIDLSSTAYVWNTGHRIRVDISSSNYPRFLNNPNTTDGIYGNTTTKIAANFVNLNTSYPSCILLPEM